MSTKQLYFTGKCKWCKTKETDQFGKYTIDLYLDDDSWKTFHDSGIQIKTRSDDEGDYVQFKRVREQVINGESVDFGPPNVAVSTGSGDYEPFDGLVGNGSLVTVRVAVYDTARGNGHRWEGVGVEDLVEFNPEQQELPF